MADIRETFSKGLTAINLKTSNYLEVAKLKTYINTLSNESDALKLEVANLLYVQWVNGAFEKTADIEDKLMQIKQRQELIEQKQKEIENVEKEEQNILGNKNTGVKAGVIYCSSCGAQNNEENRFCEKCGSPLK